MAVGGLPAPVISTVNVTASSAKKIDLNGKRQRLYMENTSLTIDVWINWGADAVVGQGRRLQAGGGAMEIDLSQPGYDDWAKDAVYMIADGASADVAVEELSAS
jgi:hypothetical protein